MTDLVISPKKLERLKKQHLKVQDQIKNLPEESREIIAKQKLMADLAFEQMNNQYFDFIIDEFLTAHDIAGNHREQFIATAKRCKGKTFVFETTKGAREFYVARDGTITFALNYIYLLEKSLIIKQQNYINDTFTNLTLFDIVKLTIKKLFGGLNG
jgi:hypothetical protein